MSATATSTTASGQQPPPSQRGNHHGRPRRNRPIRNGGTPESGGRGGRNPSLALRPSSLPPAAQTAGGEALTNNNNTTTQQTHQRGGRSHNRGRGGASRPQRMVNGREFGGKLTSAEPDASTPQLQAEAAEFVPGQPIVKGRTTKQPPVNAARRRRPSKSIAPDILTRTHEDIEHGHYECPICTSEVQRNSKVWSCHTCWTVFHLACVKKWAANEGSAAARRQSLSNGETPPPRQWRCPGCNLPKDEQPKAYTCWCGKETDPRPPTGIPPHSCGNSCGKERVKKCPHPCQLTCHAGPCPPCTYMGPTQSCFCGKNESSKRCVETDYEKGWSCEEICGDIMPCGAHTCPNTCHEGLCGACEETVDATCYCGQDERQILCREQGEPLESKRKDSLDPEDAEFSQWTGTFQCTHLCNRLFDCGKHQCEKRCHAQDADSAHCPRSPDVVSHCPCGKTPLTEFSGTLRTSCSDTIPNCDKKCSKPLSCGHACELSCHSGECLPCMKTVQISCICGRTTSITICHQGTEERPQCMRVCRALLSCGRHACDERCCSGERKAAERQATKKKRAPLGSAAPAPDLIEAEHICTRVCGRPLKCGNHTCQELCHKGPCGSCREAIFHELPCDCGRTVLEPPLPCGTRPPPCRFQCERPKACGHPQVQHNCHQDDETCPKCPFLVERRCMCGKKVLKNQQCWLQDVRCGQVCGHKLKCGSHFCRKPCHKPGECEDTGGQTCSQPCGKPKKVCGHPDENPCHAPFACKEDKPCTSKIFITCDCQALKQEAKCGASRMSEGNLNKKLPCTDECARLERNRRLAVALNIDQSTHVDGGDHIPYSEDVLNLFQQHSKWAQSQEREFRVFADSPDEKRFRFKPMTAQQRAFIHALADDFGFDSESMDPEPHRHVLLLKTPRFVSAPTKTIAECVRIRMTQRSLLASQPAVDKSKQSSATNDTPMNAFVISGPRFGLTIEEVRATVQSTSSSGPTMSISFLPSDEVIIQPPISPSLPPLDAEQSLRTLKPALASAVETASLGTLSLCAIDPSLNVIRRESDPSAADGWSRVAAKGAAPRKLQPVAPTGRGNAFSALSGGQGRVTFAKRREKKPAPVEKVVDDWEEEMEAEERRAESEKAISDGEELGHGETGLGYNSLACSNQ
ncbi:hypothetical protein K461DRAFT_284239 [Myriangium duriaei CBS 260.36]|uniref:R3H domain-containing protein n=1 Tax=Myriangium duriaei CBS 260.36 TaxID=1168546 RepID=A0A9P4JA09_9PEZI|nr:hypothetical protein K461DRAFT_284239 [Myriangium duriaei CBS 260.36]